MSMAEKIFKEIKNAIKTRTSDRLTFHEVEQDDFDRAMQGLRLAKNYLEEHAFRIHWFPREKYLKVVMPSALHESPGGWVNEEVYKGLATGVIPQAWIGKIRVYASLDSEPSAYGSSMLWLSDFAWQKCGDTKNFLCKKIADQQHRATISGGPGIEYNNFCGQYEGYVKEADMTFIPLLGPDWTKKREFPSVVLESGWSEPADRLHLDASLWQDGSEGGVRVVIQVKFYKRQAGRIGSRLWISRAQPTKDSFKITSEKYNVLPPPIEPEEDPSITFDELFAGGCPPGMDPEGSIVLNIENLRRFARTEIIALGCVPDE